MIGSPPLARRPPGLPQVGDHRPRFTSACAESTFATCDVRSALPIRDSRTPVTHPPESTGAARPLADTDPAHDRSPSPARRPLGVCGPLRLRAGSPPLARRPPSPAHSSVVGPRLTSAGAGAVFVTGMATRTRSGSGPLLLIEALCLFLGQGKRLAAALDHRTRWGTLGQGGVAAMTQQAYPSTQHDCRGQAHPAKPRHICWAGDTGRRGRQTVST